MGIFTADKRRKLISVVLILYKTIRTFSFMSFGLFLVIELFKKVINTETQSHREIVYLFIKDLFKTLIYNSMKTIN